MSYEQDVIHYTEQLIAFNSFRTQGKLAIIDYVYQLLSQETQAELIVNSDVEPCLIARLKGQSRDYKLLLEGHLDVVNAASQQFSPNIEHERLFGRGSVDMKSGCACLLSAFIEASKKDNLKADLTLVLTTDEETTGATIKHLLEQQIISDHDLALIPEPTHGQLCYAHKGQTWFSVEFFGQAAHSSTPELGNNAIEMACDFIYNLRKQTQCALQDAVFGSETLSIGVIEGGTDTNVVPDYAKLRIDKRYLPGQTMAVGLEQIERTIKQCQSQNPNFQALVHTDGNWASFYTDPKHPQVQKVTQIISASMAQDTQHIVWSAWGEASFISQFGIPALYFGPGELSQAHTENESVDIQHLVKVARAYQDIIDTLCF